MFKPKKKTKNVNFILENKYYRKIHLIVYFFTLLVIVTIYFILVFLLHDKSIRAFTFVFCSIVLGVFLVFKRDHLVLELSDWHQERSRKKIKDDDKEGLRTTIRRIVPRNKNLKLNIKGKVPLKDRFDKLKAKMKKKDPQKKETPDYIEIKD